MKMNNLIQPDLFTNAEVPGSSQNFGNTNVGGALPMPTKEELYYEFSFRKHCFKFERNDVGYICTTDEDEEKAYQKMIDEIEARQQ